MPAKSVTRLIKVGDLLAEVDVELLHDADAWAPHLSMQDMRRIERVREALESGDPGDIGHGRGCSACSARRRGDRHGRR